MRTLAALCFLAMIAPAFGQKMPEPKDRPQLIFAEPFAVEAGKPTKLKLRGLKLDGMTEVRCHDPKATAKLAGKPAKVSVPDAKLLPLLGDAQIEIELTLPPDTPHREVTIAAVNAAGESNALRLVIDDGLPRVAEKEPNKGFRDAQPIRLGCVVEGAIQSPQDVDVFAFEGQAGQHVVFTAEASRYGSPLEAMLTLYDAAGHVVRQSDDVGRGENPRLDLTLPREGRYYMAVIDAHDTGSAFHRYRLRAEEKLGEGRGGKR